MVIHNCIAATWQQGQPFNADTINFFYNKSGLNTPKTAMLPNKKADLWYGGMVWKNKDNRWTITKVISLHSSFIR